MNIDVKIGKRYFGGYGCSHYRVAVRYEQDGDTSLNISDSPVFLELLSSILVGQKSPVDIDCGLNTRVPAGQTITRSHVKAIASNWWLMDFKDTPWAERVADIEPRAEQETMKREVAAGRLNVTVTLTYLEHGRQQAGKFTLRPEVARWLGEQLIALANGMLSADGAEIEVRRDRLVSAVKHQKKREDTA